MTREEFDQRYKNHPLGIAMRMCERENNLAILHRYFIVVKAHISLMRYQEDLTKEEGEALTEMLHQLTDHKLGNAETKH